MSVARWTYFIGRQGYPDRTVAGANPTRPCDSSSRPKPISSASDPIFPIAWREGAGPGSPPSGMAIAGCSAWFTIDVNQERTVR